MTVLERSQSLSWLVPTIQEKNVLLSFLWKITYVYLLQLPSKAIIPKIATNHVDYLVYFPRLSKIKRFKDISHSCDFDTPQNELYATRQWFGFLIPARGHYGNLIVLELISYAMYQLLNQVHRKVDTLQGAISYYHDLSHSLKRDKT